MIWSSDTVKTELGHRGDEAEMAALSRRRVLWAGDVSDSPMAEAGDVLDGKPDPAPVVDGDGGHRSVLDAAVDQHERRPAGTDVRDQFVVKPCGGGNEPIDLAGVHRLEMTAFAVGVVVRVGDQGRVTVLVQAILYPSQDRREHGVRDVGHQHPDRVRPVRLQPAGDGVRTVIEVLRGTEHALCRLLVHEASGLGVQRAGDRARVDVGQTSDIPDRDRASHPGHY